MSKVQRMLRFPEVITTIGLSRQRIYQLMAEGKFPRSIKLSPGGQAVGWPEDVVAAWQEALVAAQDRR